MTNTYPVLAAFALFVAAAVPGGAQTAPARTPRPATPVIALPPPAVQAGLEQALAAARAGMPNLPDVSAALADAERALAAQQGLLAGSMDAAGFDMDAAALEAALAGADVTLSGGAVDLAALALTQDPASEREQAARERAQAERERARDARERARDHLEQEADLYQGGYEALSDGKYDRALDLFNRVIATNGSYADRALYWKAYSQYKLGQGANALATVAELQRAHPDSRYLTDAKALAAEIRENAGQPASPASQDNEDLKLLALRALQNSDPAQAVPMLVKFLHGTESPRLKERALFVLAQSRSDQARDALAAISRGESNPDLQMRAIQYLGFSRDDANKALLGDIYAKTADVAVKRRILRAYGMMGDRARVLQAAQTETSPELRSEAVRQLGMMKASDELMALYQKETDPDVKQDILRAMFIGGNADLLLKLAQSETNPELKRTAVQNLGLLPKEKTGDALTAIYTGDTSLDVRKAAIQALFLQNNDAALVALARKESNPELKKNLVSKLSLMKSKVALDYLMELLNK